MNKTNREQLLAHLGEIELDLVRYGRCVGEQRNSRERLEKYKEDLVNTLLLDEYGTAWGDDELEVA